MLLLFLGMMTSPTVDRYSTSMHWFQQHFQGVKRKSKEECRIPPCRMLPNPFLSPQQNALPSGVFNPIVYVATAIKGDQVHADGRVLSREQGH